MPKNKRSGYKAFTLIELLVAIAIISILSAIGFVIYSKTQKTARINRVIQDFDSFKSALEIYKSKNGKYPVVTTTNLCVGNANSLEPILGAEYFRGTMPGDYSDTSCMQYLSPDGTDYKLSYSDGNRFMKKADYAGQPNLINPDDDGGGDCKKVELPLATMPYYSWAIYSDGGACL